MNMIRWSFWFNNSIRIIDTMYTQGFAIVILLLLSIVVAVNAGIGAYLACVATCSGAALPLALGGCEILCLPLLAAPTP